MFQTAIVGLGRWGQVLVESVQDQSKSIRFVYVFYWLISE